MVYETGNTKDETKVTPTVEAQYDVSDLTKLTVLKKVHEDINAILRLTMNVLILRPVYRAPTDSSKRSANSTQDPQKRQYAQGTKCKTLKWLTKNIVDISLLERNLV